MSFYGPVTSQWLSFQTHPVARVHDWHLRRIKNLPFSVEMLGLGCEAHVSCSCWDDLQVHSGNSASQPLLKMTASDTHAHKHTRWVARGYTRPPTANGWCHVTSLGKQVPEYIIMPKHSSLNTISQSFQQIKSSLDDSWLTNSSGVKTKERGREITQTSRNDGTSGTNRHNVMFSLMITGRDLIVIISRGP